MLDLYATRQTTIRVMMVAQDASLIETVRRHLTDRYPIELVETAQTGRQCLAILSDVDPSVVIIAEGLADIEYLQLVRQIGISSPGVATVVLSLSENVQTYQEIMGAGARGVVKVTRAPEEWLVSGEELDWRIRQAHELIGPVREARARAVQSKRRRVGGEIVAVYSAKGGVGKSVCAVGLALLWAQRDPRKKVALVDLNLQFGVDTVYLNLPSYHSVIDLVTNINALGPGTLDALVAKKDFGAGSELYFVPAPSDPRQADQVLGSHVASVLSALRRHYDVTLVDTTATISDVTLAALQASTRILFVCTQDMLAVRQTRAALELLRDPEFGIDTESFSLIINRVNRHSEIKPESIAALFDISCVGMVPEDVAFFEKNVNVGGLADALMDSYPVVKGWKEILSRLEPDRSMDNRS